MRSVTKLPGNRFMLQAAFRRHRERVCGPSRGTYGRRALRRIAQGHSTHFLRQLPPGEPVSSLFNLHEADTAESPATLQFPVEEKPRWQGYIPFQLARERRNYFQTGDMSNEVGRVKIDSAGFLILLQTPVLERSGNFCSEHLARVSVLFCAPTRLLNPLHFIVQV
jgi:hypothetical protein